MFRFKAYHRRDGPKSASAYMMGTYSNLCRDINYCIHKNFIKMLGLN
jgi:hypothetical protein